MSAATQNEIDRLYRERDKAREERDALAHRLAKAEEEKQDNSALAHWAGWKTRALKAEAERDALSIEHAAMDQERSRERLARMKAEKERDALAAHVERLREGLHHALMAWHYEASQGDGIMEEHGSTYEECRKRCDETPATSLARLKDERAQAIQQAVKQARMEWAKEDKA